jgi:cytochrome c oxidase subunit 3
MNEKKIFKRREPFAFMLYLAIFGSTLLFFAIFVIFLKKELVNQNIPLVLPKVFWVSSLVILGSSLSIFFAKKNLENQKFTGFKTNLAITYLLGLAFLVLQITGWTQHYISNSTIFSSETVAICLSEVTKGISSTKDVAPIILSGNFKFDFLRSSIVSVFISSLILIMLTWSRKSAMTRISFEVIFLYERSSSSVIIET